MLSHNFAAPGGYQICNWVASLNLATYGLASVQFIHTNIPAIQHHSFCLILSHALRTCDD